MNAKSIFVVFSFLTIQSFISAQLLPVRSIGVFGYQTVEPLGFNSHYSGIVDEWGNIPLPVMNLAMSGSEINAPIWSPTKSALDGQYLLTGQVNIENVSKELAEKSGLPSDTIQFRLSGNSSSLVSAHLESSGAWESLVWQVSGQAGCQRLGPTITTLAPWGQPDFEVVNLYANAGGQVSKRLRISGRLAAHHSASMYTTFDHEAVQNLYAGRPRNSVTYFIDSIVPPIMDTTYYRFAPFSSAHHLYHDAHPPLPFNAFAQIEGKTNCSLKLDFNATKGMWSLLLDTQDSRWYQRVSANVANVVQPAGILNSSASITRIHFRQNMRSKLRMGFIRSTRQTEFTFGPNEISFDPRVIDAVNNRISLGGEVFRDYDQTKVWISGVLDYDSKFGFLGSGIAHLDYQPLEEISGAITIGHGWREPSPFEHQWKSLLNADELNGQSESGIGTNLHTNFDVENATFAQMRLNLWEKSKKTKIQIILPLSIIHNQWNVDMKGVPTGTRFDPYDSRYGIMLSREPGYLAGVTASALFKLNNGMQLQLNFNKITSMQRKGGLLSSEYNSPRQRFVIGASKSWHRGESKFYQLSTKAERMGPVLYSIDQRNFDLDEYINYPRTIETENVWSPPFWEFAVDASVEWKPNWSSQISFDYSTLRWKENPSVWYLGWQNSDRIYELINADIDPNASSVYGPLVRGKITINLTYHL